MDWVTEDQRHKGYLVAVLANGRDAPHDERAWDYYDGADGRPLAVGVRAGCDCHDDSGYRTKEWRGGMVFRAMFGDQEGTEGVGEDASPYWEWKTQHVGPDEDTTVPGDVTELLDTLRTRLSGLADQRPLAALTAVSRLEATGQAVSIRAAAAAQQRGNSWTQIGTALGVSKQAAHQRLARPVATLKAVDPAHFVRGGEGKTQRST
ncbi:hypothetical protein ACVWZD_000385 [Streptomyces sp. TE3672]